MFAAKCDNCKCEVFDNSDYSCYGDKEQVREEIDNADWLIEEEKGKEPKHYCPACFSYDDEDNVVINKDRFKE